MYMVILAFLGLAIGSFINALVWRLQQQSLPKTKRPKVNLSIARGRSVCVHCKHKLAWHDLIPVFSWLYLRGKCHYCKRQISWQYPVVELATASLFVLSFIFWPFLLASLSAWLKFAVWLGILTVLIALALYDFKTKLLPNKLLTPLALLVFADFVLKISNGFNLAILLSAVSGLLAFGGVFYVLYQVSGGKWLGGGDVKLSLIMGAYLANPLKGILAIFLSSLLGTLIVLVMLIRGKVRLKMQLPFGPMLVAGTLLTIFFGQNLLDWYTGLFL
jgi:prepilin signal peptidase PulO-like enzyme (type II secretory pathway)